MPVPRSGTENPRRSRPAAVAASNAAPTAATNPAVPSSAFRDRTAA